MRRTGLVLLTPTALLMLAACASGGDTQSRARDRCLAAGGKPDTPEFTQCVRDTEVWMEQNRALQRRIYTQ